jgi:NAD(P)-dependent dehydrogenase (short-subunit alcohol dehydrogenase family)
MRRLEGRVAIVTGSTSGIGLTTAQTMADEGAAVAISGIDADRAVRAASEIVESGGASFGILADVTDRAQVNALIATTLERFGRIDILVNNAAPKGFRKPFVETDPEDWEPEIDVSLRGMLHCCRAALPHMLAQRSGRIINITSGAGKAGIPLRTLYSACKAGIAGFSRAVAREVAADGITVNCVAPGPVLTPRRALVASEHPDWEKQMYASIPVGRAAQPAEVAALVVYLASDAGAFITGQDYSIDGGFYM